MVDQRLTDRDVLEAPVGDDLIHVVDISDITGSPQGTSKQTTLTGIIMAAGVIPENQVVINSESDFPMQSATEIMLEADRVYIPGASFSTSKSFIVGQNVVIFGRNSSVLWEYTGTGNMFDGMNVEMFSFFRLSVRATAAAQIFNFTDTVPLTSTIQINELIGSPADPGSLISGGFGTFTNVQDVRLTMIEMDAGLGINDGIVLGGTQLLGLFIEDIILISSSSATFIGLDFGNVVVTGFVSVKNLTCSASILGAFGISGLPNSGNIGAGLLATISDCQFFDQLASSPLNGIEADDLQYKFINNDPILESTIDFFATMTDEETVNINNQGVFVPIAGGNWIATQTNRWTLDADGIATFIPGVNALIQINVKLEGNISVSGGSNLVAMRINIDTGSGFPVSPPIRSQSEAQASNAPSNITSVDIVTIGDSDRVRLEVANMDGTSNIVVSANARFLSPNAF